MKRFLKYFIIIMVTFFWSIVLYTSFFDIQTTDPMKPYIVIFGCITYFGILYLIYKKCLKCDEKKKDKIAIILSAAMFVLMLVWGLSHRVISTYDLAHITSKVSEILTNNVSLTPSYYFSVYAQQIPTIQFFYYIGLIGKIFTTDFVTVFIIYNCLMVSLSSYLLYKIVKMKSNSNYAMIALLLMVLYPDFYLFASYYYTDIIGVPLCIFGYYFILKSDREEEHKNKKIIYLVLGIIFAFIVYKIRVTNAILFFGYILYLFLTKKKLNIKSIAKVLCLIAIVFIPMKLLYSSFESNTVDKSDTLPITHWLMMGLNPESNGMYTSEAMDYSTSSNDKVKDNLNKILEYLPQDDAEFFYNKIKINWSSGEHGTLLKYKNNSNIDYTYNYLISKKSLFLKYLLQIMNVTIYVLFFITVLRNIRFINSNFDIIISILGAIVFYLFWEVQPRYSFTFLPWIIIGCAESISVIETIIESKSVIFDKEKINFKFAKKLIGIAILCFSAIMIVNSFIKYSCKSVKVNNVLLSQYSTNEFIPILGDGIRNEFELDKNFNTVEIAFKAVGSSRYYFRLYDGDNLLDEQSFSSEWATKKDLVVLRFPTVEVNENKKFTIKIQCQKCDENNYMLIGAVSNKDSENQSYDGFYIDFDPKSVLYVNGEPSISSMRIKVVDYEEDTTYMTKIEYLIIALFIVVALYFGIFKVLIKRK